MINRWLKSSISVATSEGDLFLQLTDFGNWMSNHGIALLGNMCCLVLLVRRCVSGFVFVRCSFLSEHGEHGSTQIFNSCLQAEFVHYEGRVSDPSAQPFRSGCAYSLYPLVSGGDIASTLL